MRGLRFILLFLPLAAMAQPVRLMVNDNVDRRLWQERYVGLDVDDHLPFRHGLHEGSLDTVEVGHQWKNGYLIPVGALTSEGYFESDELESSSIGLAGVGLHHRFSEKWTFDGALFGGGVLDPVFPDRLTRDSNVLDGIGRLEGDDSPYTSIDGLFALGFRPSELFYLEAGRAKHFYGDGYRSLYLSDHAAPYPYLKLTTQVWRIRYENLFTSQQGVFNPFAAPTDFERKFTTTHIFSFNISETTNVNLFETIIWQAEDSLSQRGYDVNYLNPIIFFRPVEFARGSADNAIIGFGINHRIWPSYQIYGQLVFDEFLLQEFRNQTGWWANKYGWQIGLKAFDVAQIDGLYLQLEWNIVRPFTYSHGSPLQSYSHLNQALAHPAGANFSEWVLIGYYEKGPWEWRLQSSFLYKGDDEPGRKYGGDIFRSYVDPFRNFDNRIGQGLRTETVSNRIQLARVLDKSMDLRIQLGYGFDYRFGEAGIGRMHVLSLGVRSSFFDGYR